MTIYVSMLVRNMIACLLYGCSLSVCRDPHNISTKEGVKKSFRGWEKCRRRCGKEVGHESVNPKVEENFTKIYGTCNARH